MPLRNILALSVVVVVFSAIGISTALRPSAGQSEAAQTAQSRLSALPLAFGGWTGAENPVSQKHLRIAEVDASLSRTYKHAKTGETVTVLLLAGPPGPLGAHTPETCFAGAGYRQIDTPSPRPLPGSGGELWQARFEPPTLGAPLCTVAWGWSAGDGHWTAATDARLTFSTQALVYKLYVTRALPLGPSSSGGVSDPVAEFLTRFLAAFDATPST